MSAPEQPASLTSATTTHGIAARRQQNALPQFTFNTARTSPPPPIGSVLTPPPSDLTSPFSSSMSSAGTSSARMAASMTTYPPSVNSMSYWNPPQTSPYAYNSGSGGSPYPPPAGISNSSSSSFMRAYPSPVAMNRGSSSRPTSPAELAHPQYDAPPPTPSFPSGSSGLPAIGQNTNVPQHYTYLSQGQPSASGASSQPPINTQPQSPHDPFAPNPLTPSNLPQPYYSHSHNFHGSQANPHSLSMSNSGPSNSSLMARPLVPGPSPYHPPLPLQPGFRPTFALPGMQPQAFSHTIMPHHVHPGVHHQSQADRPFKCDQCPQSFNRNHDLKRHKRIHLAVKPFPCNNCDKSFSRKDALKRHRLVKGCGKSDSPQNLNGESSFSGSKRSPVSPTSTINDSSQKSSGSPTSSNTIIKKER